MKISNWRLDDLIDYLLHIKCSNCFDYACVPMCFGELQFFNGELKKGTEDGKTYKEVDWLL